MKIEGICIDCVDRTVLNKLELQMGFGESKVMVMLCSYVF